MFSSDRSQVRSSSECLISIDCGHSNFAAKVANEFRLVTFAFDMGGRCIACRIVGSLAIQRGQPAHLGANRGFPSTYLRSARLAGRRERRQLALRSRFGRHLEGGIRLEGRYLTLRNLIRLDFRLTRRPGRKSVARQLLDMALAAVFF